MAYRGWIGSLLLAAVFSARADGQGCGQPNERSVSRSEASKLVYEGIKKHNTGATIHAMADRYDQVFMYFQAIWPNPVGSPVIGNFAVNPFTGDVWNTGGCERVSSPSLRKDQQGIRKRFRLAGRQYARLHAMRPICGGD